MKPVRQTIFGSPHGNCFQACVASILELPLEDVPHFCDGDNSRWFLDLELWLKKYGLAPILVAAKGCPTLDGVVSIAGGPAKRGVKHAVVYRGNDLVWDPHPSDDGLISVEDFTFFIVIDPKNATGGKL